ncbi:general transcription factor 3C polypeptide 3-like isoform X1 [Salvia splendens]|uniref:general transcription factor 3C polypeptide 3-like isoform X1 n=1 Tax=Salvia splendens TaxID=180675 RepID=UPI001C25B68B|nr:general transcription factor 3C polypeptide 3-like isoform X1 [Salvia splendens]XP_042015157.1 general transcription factor 3C polypeptide 3-like isoform X1 [Salvia splendens]XP_042015158.1 general transcription factor 3C polypeptide 3-like isoform X1 [Salvia splendens]XP_042015159.1 general transcription factor 3C polypeptide 3-like isoform X1 [Salvia splendens]XP_042015160.1 general transcription factor 3C polypeptide 3-like isoform X1 [Salvia splendens]XP_042015161.1 general transcriptio
MKGKRKMEKPPRFLKMENRREKKTTIFNLKAKWTPSLSSRAKTPRVCRFCEVFQQIEDQYKALAAKKHPAPHENESETPAKRLRQEEENAGATREEIEEAMNFGVRKRRRRRRSRKERRRGRRKGTKNKLNPEVTRKLGDATLHYAQGYFDKGICLLHEVIRLAPNLSDPYHTLGLIYSAIDDNKRAMIFYMIAAHLNPKDASLWKLLLAKINRVRGQKAGLLLPQQSNSSRSRRY